MKVQVKKFLSVDSTNNVAINFIKKNKTKPTLIIANIQKKGRGTMGKKWISRKGNLFISIFFQINNTKLDFKDFSTLNPYIITSVIKKYSYYKINIKWPNDILIKSKKVCGILQEIIKHKKKKYLIIGIGINTLKSCSTKDFESTSLQKCTNIKVNNNKILREIKITYEKFLSDIKKYNFSNLKKKICKI